MVLGSFFFLLMVPVVFLQAVSSTNYSLGWKVYSENELQKWSKSVHLRTGDYLVFNYSRPSYGSNHNVLEVTSNDFRKCNTTNPIKTYNGEESVVKLSEAGTKFFICGHSNHCRKGQRVLIHVYHTDCLSPCNSVG